MEHAALNPLPNVSKHFALAFLPLLEIDEFIQKLIVYSIRNRLALILHYIEGIITDCQFHWHPQIR